MKREKRDSVDLNDVQSRQMGWFGFSSISDRRPFRHMAHWRISTLFFFRVASANRSDVIKNRNVQLRNRADREPNENNGSLSGREKISLSLRHTHRPVDGQRTLERFSRVILAIVDVRIEVVRKSRIVRPWQRFQVRTYLANLDFFYRNLFATSR